MEREDEWGLEAAVAGIRADVRHLATDVTEIKQEFRTDIRRLDERIFQLMLLQLGTLATALASLVAALLS